MYCKCDGCPKRVTCERWLLAQQLTSDHDKDGPYVFFVPSHVPENCDAYKEDKKAMKNLEAAYDKWYEEHCQTIYSYDGERKITDYPYYYAELYDGKIYALGDEDGRNGGIYCGLYFRGRDELINSVERLARRDKIEADSVEPADEHEAFWRSQRNKERHLYEKIKDCPIMTAEEYDAAVDERRKFPRELDYWTLYKKTTEE